MKLLFTCHGQSESLKVILSRLKPRESQEQGHARQPPSPGDTAWKHSHLQWLRSDTTRGLPCRDAASSWEEGTEDAAATGECSGCALWSACPCRAFWPWGTGSLHRGWEHSRSARPGSSPGSPTPPALLAPPPIRWDSSAHPEALLWEFNWDDTGSTCRVSGT